MSDPFNFPQQELLRYRPLLLDAIERITSSGQVILGEGVRQFEAGLAHWLGAGCEPERVIGVANGTDALELALRAAGVGLGDRVLLPSHTAYATAAAVLRVEAVPVFVDLEPGRSVLSVAHLAHRLEEAGRRPGGAFRAVIAVHLYGEACDLAALGAFCAQHGLALIEDCAQACGTTYQGRAVGTWGDFAAFSFYPTKNLAAFGDGGALVVNRPEVVEVARPVGFTAGIRSAKPSNLASTADWTSCRPGRCWASCPTWRRTSRVAAASPAGTATCYPTPPSPSLATGPIGVTAFICMLGGSRSQAVGPG